jgi:ribosomal protein S18 acetylase RimI-like enzyme
MTVEFRRSSDFSLPDLASVFTASYEGYLIPFVVDETQLRYMIEVFDLDVSRSLVAVERDRPVGLANLGRRGEMTWLGGVGVMPSHRGSGVGESLSRMLLDQARETGAREMVLEVIVENTRAFALYEKLGFMPTRELQVLSLGSAAEHSEARETDLEVARRVVAATRSAPEPWQRADETVANLTRRGSTPRAIIADGAAAIFSQEGTASACSRPRATPPDFERSPPHCAPEARSRRSTSPPTIPSRQRCTKQGRQSRSSNTRWSFGSRTRRLSGGARVSRAPPTPTQRTSARSRTASRACRPRPRARGLPPPRRRA